MLSEPTIHFEPTLSGSSLPSGGDLIASEAHDSLQTCDVSRTFTSTNVPPSLGYYGSGLDGSFPFKPVLANGDVIDYPYNSLPSELLSVQVHDNFTYALDVFAKRNRVVLCATKENLLVLGRPSRPGHELSIWMELSFRNRLFSTAQRRNQRDRVSVMDPKYKLHTNKWSANVDN